MEMTKEDILKSFHEAKDKRKQIKILAELNLCEPATIIAILKEGGVDGRRLPTPRKKKPKSPAESVEAKPEDVKTEPEGHDVVNHPSHYTSGRIEVIDYIEDQKLGYHLGNAVKYISRAGKKDPTKKVEDLRKAAWYIDREIKRLTKEGTA